MANKSSYSSVLIFRKLHSNKDFISATEHNLRWKKPLNADPKRDHQNKIHIGGDKSFVDLVNARIKACNITPRKNAVRGLEFVLSAGGPFYKNIKSRDQWVNDSITFLSKNFHGKANIVHLTDHDDETTPHLHIIVTPIVAANDRDGPSGHRKKRKKREWKLDCKGIFESLASKCELGKLDRSAAEFRQSDFISSFKMINRLLAKTDPVAAHLVSKMPPSAVESLANPKLKLVDKRKVLITELNKILSGPSIFNDQVFAKISLPTEMHELKNGYPVGDNLYILNRKLIGLAFPSLIKKCVGRPIGNPTTPFIHQLQVDYFNLCKKLDPKISEPLYRARMDHQELADFFANAKKGQELAAQPLAIQVNPPAPGAKITPEEHTRKETERIQGVLKDALEPLIATAAQNGLLQKEVENLKAGIRRANGPHNQEKQEWVAETEDLKRQIAALKEEQAMLLRRLRTIPLDEVLSKLGYTQRVPGKDNQYQLPDERVIEITGTSFKDLSGRSGLGSMSNRKAAKGAIDLVMFLTGWDLALTQKWFKSEFDHDEALSAAADKYKETLVASPEYKITSADAQAFKEPLNSPLTEDVNQWLSVRAALATAHGLDLQLVDDLRKNSILAANQHGALMCVKYNRKQVVGAMMLGLTPNPVTGIKSFYDTSYDGGYPFSIGSPRDEIAAIVSSPLEAMAYYELSNRKCQVLATQSPLPPAILNGLQQRATETGHPVFLAHSLSSEDETLAEKMKTQLESAGVPTDRHQPPQFHDNAKTWGDLLAASKGKLANFAGLAQEAVQAALEKCKEWFGIDDPPAPPAAEMRPTHAPKIPPMEV